MRVLKRGHVYELDHRGGNGTTTVSYVNTEPGQESPGVLQQELLRMLIDRNRYCNNCLPHPNNERIEHHLRMVLALHEARAIERKVEKDGMAIEYVPIGEDGHFVYDARPPVRPVYNTRKLDPVPPRSGKSCHRSHE